MARTTPTERARRLLALLPHLREQGTHSLARLAEALGTDEASVAADLGTLSVCGVDDWDLVAVYVEDDEAVVFGELPALDRPVRLTAAEARALLAALDACGVDPDSPLVERIGTLASGALDAASLSRTVRAAIAPGGLAHTHAALSALACAGHTARITYASRGDDVATERVVEPWRLFASRGAWYLQAWSPEAEADRTYRLDRITAVEPAGGTFTPPQGLPAATDAAPDPATLPRAVIVFAHDAPDLTAREWPGATFERRADGTVVAAVPFAGTAWIARMVASRLGDAVVTGPAEVRSAVVRLALDEIAGL
ncbi:MAG: WYL domain-containing protein [Coriobacteriia bacterium]|nr:WYL domain-containing protein [Coriobacteriia bacterium]